MHRAWESTTLATLFACVIAQIATFAVDKSLVSVFMICSSRGREQRKKVSVQRRMSMRRRGDVD
jgi:hypothetical protein